MDRRQWLKFSAAGVLAWQLPALAAVKQRRPKLIWILLRGGMDSLHAVIPLGDNHLAGYRQSMVEAVSGQALDIGGGFALHPAFKNLHQLYRQGQMTPVLATAAGQHTRSHFRAQDILECGLPILNHDSGWLNRAVDQYRGEGMAIAHAIPVSLRGVSAAKSWYPDLLPPADDDLYSRLQTLYASDEQLAMQLQQGLQARSELQGMTRKGNRQRMPVLAEACGKLLSAANGPDCAMLEMSGWDTHNNAATRLDRQFSELDDSIASLRSTMGATWDDTVVMIASEFGRTVAENGTKGTDHGTAGAMFLAGGAVQGGKIIGDWPGLARSDLFEGRDLQPTSDIRQWMATVLQQHWQLSGQQLSQVFPDVTASSQRLIKTL